MTVPEPVALTVPDLRDESFFLRPFDDGDIAQLIDPGPDEEMRRWMTIRADPITEDAVRADVIGPAKRGWREGTMAHFAICGLEDNCLLGSISLRFYRYAIAEVGYDLMPHGRGRGIATKAVRLVAEWAFNELGVKRIELRTHPANIPSQRVAERAGFVREGVERSSRRLYDERHDCVLFSLLPTDVGTGLDGSAKPVSL